MELTVPWIFTSFSELICKQELPQTLTSKCNYSGSVRLSDCLLAHSILEGLVWWGLSIGCSRWAYFSSDFGGHYACGFPFRFRWAIAGPWDPRSFALRCCAVVPGIVQETSYITSRFTVTVDAVFNFNFYLLVLSSIQLNLLISNIFFPIQGCYYFQERVFAINKIKLHFAPPCLGWFLLGSYCVKCSSSVFVGIF